MNGLQHLTTPTSLKFCLALSYSSGPNSSKFDPSCPQVGPNFFSFGERDGDNLFRARANPESTHTPSFKSISSVITEILQNFKEVYVEKGL